MDGASKGAGRWTAERVGESVIEAFRLLPTMPVYSPRRMKFMPVLHGQDMSPLDVLALSERVLGRASPDRRVLLLWARSIATGGDVGGSVRQYCVERCIDRRTFDRRRRAACSQIAEAMNRVEAGALAALDGLRETAPGIANMVERL